MSGLGLAWRQPWARGFYLIACELLLYTVIVSPGYYAHAGDVGFAVMFAVVLTGTVVAIVAVWREGT